MRLRFVVPLLAALLVIPSGAVGAAPAVDTTFVTASRCVSGDVATAGAKLFGAGTEFAGTNQVGGLTTALVLEPYIAPGTRHRLVSVPGGWCDAEAAFNHAWQANGRSYLEGAAMAEAYARLAAAPYFDQTTVTSRTSVAGVHTINTHSLTNGVEAKWTIVTDALGVRVANWATTDFAVKPFVPQWEGLTAVDGAKESYTRSVGGTVLAGHGLPTSDIDEPAAELSYTGADGFKVVVSMGDSRNAVDVGTDTGNSRVDILRMTRDVVRENYEDFYAWGFRGDWAPHRHRINAYVGGLTVNSAPTFGPAKTGYVSIDDQTSVFCQACVWIADDFQIHMVSEFRAFLEALGYTYPGSSDKDVFSDILGHEMFHNWQNNYVKPDATKRSVPGSYAEGTARFQETLHSYSHVSHQPDSLLYANDTNGCNGLSASDAGMSAGAFETQLYDACNFFLPWYGVHGLAGFVKLVKEGAPAGAGVAGATNSAKVLKAIEVATGEPYSHSAAEWAAGAITGKGMEWGPPAGSGQTLDWGHYLNRLKPAQLLDGQSATQTLINGGVMAREVPYAFRATVTQGAMFAVLRDSDAGATLTYPAPGTDIAGPVAGEKVYVIAVNPSTAPLPTTIGIQGVGEIPSAPEPVAVKLYLHGDAPVGDGIQGAMNVASGTEMKLDANAPIDSVPKSFSFNHPFGNDVCSGNAVFFPTWVGDVEGKIVGDATWTVHVASPGAQVKARIWGGVKLGPCNEAYIPPAQEVTVDVPQGSSTVDIVFKNLNLNTQGTVMLELLQRDPTMQGRVLYDAVDYASAIRFDCVPLFGEVDCL